MKEYNSEIGSLYKHYNGDLVLIVDVAKIKTKDGMTFVNIIYESMDGEQWSQGSEGFYKSFDKVS